MPLIVSMLKMTVFQSMAISCSGMPSMAILPPWHMLASMSRKAAGLPDISRPTSKPSFMPSCFCTSASVCVAHVDGERRAHLLRQVEPVGVDVGDDDVAGAGVADDGGGHAADRAGAGDEHVFAEHVERQGGVDGVAERVEDRLRRRAGCCGSWTQTLVIGSARYSAKAPGRLTPMPLRVLAQMPPAGEAVAAAAADDVAFAADDVAGVEVVDVRADLDDPADELVADDHRHRDRLLRPGVPVVDVHVGAADAGAQHLDQHVVDAEPRDRDLFEPEPGARFLLHQGPHRFLS